MIHFIKTLHLAFLILKAPITTAADDKFCLIKKSIIIIYDVQVKKIKGNKVANHVVIIFGFPDHMGQYQLLSVLSDRLSPFNIDHSRNLPVEICGINYTEKYANL